MNFEIDPKIQNMDDYRDCYLRIEEDKEKKLYKVTVDHPITFMLRSVFCRRIADYKLNRDVINNLLVQNTKKEDDKDKIFTNYLCNILVHKMFSKKSTDRIDNYQVKRIDLILTHYLKIKAKSGEPVQNVIREIEDNLKKKKGKAFLESRETIYKYIGKITGEVLSDLFLKTVDSVTKETIKQAREKIIKYSENPTDEFIDKANKEIKKIYYYLYAFC